MSSIKFAFALLIQYSNGKTNSKKMWLILQLENWHRKLQMDVFDDPQLEGLTRYQKHFKNFHFSPALL